MLLPLVVMNDSVTAVTFILYFRDACRSSGYSAALSIQTWRVRVVVAVWLYNRP